MQYLIIGGQACILYGGAEFSRDIDFSIMPSSESLEKWRKALADLQAEPIFLPSFEQKYLEKGHGCHFRCHHPEAKGLRVDIIGRMQGCDEFPLLWKRRTVFDLPGIEDVNVISLPDLVQSKKTQRIFSHRLNILGVFTRARKKTLTCCSGIKQTLMIHKE